MARHLNLPTEAILAGRHDCDIVEGGAWRQPGGETAGVCLGLLSSEGGERQKVGGPVLATIGPRLVEQLAE